MDDDATDGRELLEVALAAMVATGAGIGLGPAGAIAGAGVSAAVIARLEQLDTRRWVRAGRMIVAASTRARSSPSTSS